MYISKVEQGYCLLGKCQEPLERVEKADCRLLFGSLSGKRLENGITQVSFLLLGQQLCEEATSAFLLPNLGKMRTCESQEERRAMNIILLFQLGGSQFSFGFFFFFFTLCLFLVLFYEWSRKSERASTGVDVLCTQFWGFICLRPNHIYQQIQDLSSYF